MTNIEIRNAIRVTGVRQWQVAEAYGLSEGNFSRLLRHELPKEKAEAILEIIKQLSTKED